MPQTLTVEAILAGTNLGGVQSVGQMEVIPILDGGTSSDDSWGPPNFSAGTPNYGQVRVQNLNSDLPTITPTGAGWISNQRAQDHATPGAKLLEAGQNRVLNDAICIQETQGGLISQKEDTQMIVLPAALRASALSMRSGGELGRLWESIRKLNRTMGVDSYIRGDLVQLLTKYERELDEFVAEFELVPDQLGAIILIGGQVVGVERAPNQEFWMGLWEPLVRVCYGSLALRARQVLGDTLPPTRQTLDVKDKSLSGIRTALETARLTSAKLVEQAVDEIRTMPLLLAGGAEDKLGNAKILTVANTRLAGQVMEKGKALPYVSLCASGA